MNAGEISQVLQSVTGLVTALGIAYSIHLSRKNRVLLKETAREMNGVKDQLVTATARASRSEGKEEGREAERGRISNG